MAVFDDRNDPNGRFSPNLLRVRVLLRMRRVGIPVPSRASFYEVRERAFFASVFVHCSLNNFRRAKSLLLPQ